MDVISPIAQSFYVEKDTGIFATSIDLYFKDVDPNIPIKVQLRPFENGKPSDIIYPGSEVILSPGQIEGSDNASVPTNFEFASPVYLEGQKFHSVVIVSNSDQYTVWTSRLGELDVTFSDESSAVIVSKQPNSGGIFKSQNNNSWVEEPYEDLTFKLYRANFITTRGNFNLTNPTLRTPKDPLVANPIEMSSKKIKIGLSEALNDPGLQIGNTVIQPGSNSTGNYVGTAGQLSTLTITNAGVDYTSGSYTGIPLVNVTSEGYDATVDLTIDLNGIITAATISNGGYGYLVGDVLTTDQIASGVGRNLRLTVSAIVGENQLILDNVQGDFTVGAASTIQYTNSSGSTVNLNGSNVTIPNGGIVTITDGLHFKVNHPNHGMHSRTNTVVIDGIISDLKPAKLSSEYSGGTELSLESSSNFETFENQPVSNSNPGYIKILGEILSYTGVSGNTLTGVVRDVDSFTLSPNAQSIAVLRIATNTYPAGQAVSKYELNGVSLRRINKQHALEDSTVEDSIGLDFYNIKIDMSSNGVDRSVSPKLYINESKSVGGSSVRASENIQFESIIPNIQTSSINGTNITARVRTVSGTSISGNEFSFEDQGFEDIELRSVNYFDSPRLICSAVNESLKLSALPGNKSFDLDIELSTTDPYISPVVDIDRAGVVFTTNRVNNAIEDYATDSRVSSLSGDPSAFTYATNIIELESPASSIKVLVTASVNVDCDLRALYAVQNDPSTELIYYPFPGFSNINNLGQIIDNSLSDGTSDSEIFKTDDFNFASDNLNYVEYEFTADNISSFRYFSIKLVGSSTNQAFPPRLKDLRVIALA